MDELVYREILVEVQNLISGVIALHNEKLLPLIGKLQEAKVELNKVKQTS